MVNYYFGWVFYNIPFFILIFLTRKRIRDSQKTIFILLFITLFLITSVFGASISPDYLSYQEQIDKIYYKEYVNFEVFYIWLIQDVIGADMLMFQFCVYGLAFFCLFISLTKVCKLDNPIIFLLFFSVILLYNFVGGRSSLFYAEFFLATCLLARKKYFIGLILLGISALLHKTAYLAIPLAILFYIPWHFTRKRIVLFGILIMCIMIGGRFIIHNYLYEVMQLFSTLPGGSYVTKTEAYREGGSIWWQFIAFYRFFIRYMLSFWMLIKLRNIGLSRRLSIDRVMYFSLFWTAIIIINNKFLGSIRFYSCR